MIPLLATTYLAAQNINYHLEDKFEVSPYSNKKWYRYQKNLHETLLTTGIVISVLPVIFCSVLKMPLPFCKDDALVYLSFFQSIDWAIVINIIGLLLRFAADNLFSRYDKFR